MCAMVADFGDKHFYWTILQVCLACLFLHMAILNIFCQHVKKKYSFCM